MLIKLNITGDMLNSLVSDAKRNMRTNPQQILYYLQEIYDGNIVINNSNTSINNVIPSSSELVQDSTNFVPSSTKDNTEDIQKIDDDMLDSIPDYVADF